MTYFMLLSSMAALIPKNGNVILQSFHWTAVLSLSYISLQLKQRKCGLAIVVALGMAEVVAQSIHNFGPG